MYGILHICLHEWLLFLLDVGKYTGSYMDPMGNILEGFFETPDRFFCVNWKFTGPYVSCLQ